MLQRGWESRKRKRSHRTDAVVGALLRRGIQGARVAKLVSLPTVTTRLCQFFAVVSGEASLTCPELKQGVSNLQPAVPAFILSSRYVRGKPLPTLETDLQICASAQRRNGWCGRMDNRRGWCFRSTEPFRDVAGRLIREVCASAVSSGSR